jgi:hypothetical protein
MTGWDLIGEPTANRSRLCPCPRRQDGRLGAAGDDHG